MEGVEQSAQRQYSSTSLSDITSSYKMGGIVERSIMKVLRNVVFEYMTFSDSVSSPYFSLHYVVSVIRLLQLYIPMLFVGFIAFWDTSSRIYQSVSFFSSVFYLYFVPNNISFHRLMAWSYIGLNSAIMGIIIVSSLYYHKTNKLASWIPRVNSVIIFAVFNTIQPIGMFYGGKIASNIVLFFNSQSDILLFILLVLSSLLFLYFYTRIICISMTLRPNSLISVSNTNQTIICIITNLLAFGSSFVPSLPVEMQIKALMIMIPLPLIGCWIPFYWGTFIESLHKVFCLTLAFSGLVNFGIVITYLIMKKKADEYIFFAFFGVLFLSYIISTGIIKRNMNRHLIYLDSIMDDDSLMSGIQFPSIIPCIITGFKVSHPVCIDWTLLKYITDMWSTNIYSWIVFAKFVSIFPENSDLLSYIHHSMIKNRFRGPIAKQSIIQIFSIIQQRESNLTATLKHKIDNIRRHFNISKRKLRNVWDQVIQGNISEMDTSVTNAFDSINRTKNELDHLIAEYPNNRYVARQYSRYIKEVLADKSQNSVWNERFSLIRRGISIKEDEIRCLGYYYFPLLPATLKVKEVISIDTDNESMKTSEADNDFETNDSYDEKVTIIKDRISNIEYSSFKFAKIMVLIISILLIVPIIVFMSATSYYIDYISEPLEIIFHTSYLRMINYQFSSFSHHYVLENNPPSNPVFQKVDLNGYIPKAFGSTTDTKEQLKFFVKNAAISLQNLNEYRTYGSGDPQYDKVRNLIFGPNILYSTYIYSNNFNTFNTTLQFIILDYCVHISRLTSLENTSHTMINTTMILNPTCNPPTVTAQMTTALQDIVKILKTVNDNLNSLISTFKASYIIVMILLTVFASVVQVLLLERDKRMVYKCLMYLPKNVVSNLADNFRIVKKEKSDSTKKDNTDYSKQEENVLKIFASASDTLSSQFSDQVEFVIATLVLIACFASEAILLNNLYVNMNVLLINNAPHLDYILGTSAFFMGMLMSFNNYAGTINGYPVKSGVSALASRSVERANIFHDYYTTTRYGSKTNDIKPFPGFETKIVDLENSRKCNDTVPTSMREVFDCYSPSEKILLIEQFVKHLLLPYLNGKTKEFNARDEIFNELWYLLAFDIYEHFLFPMFDSIIPTIQQSVIALIGPTLVPVCLLLIVIVTTEVLILYRNHRTKQKLDFALGLLLHSPPSVILQSPKIMEVLSNKSSGSSSETAKRDEIFYDEVVFNLPDSIIITDLMFTVISINKSSSNLFSSHSLIDINFKDFLLSGSFESNLQAELFAGNSFKDKELKFQTHDNSITSLSVCMTKTLQKCIFILRNQTQYVKYNALINEEKTKSDKMLASILPSLLIPRVQAGEKIISFNVQSASIVFIDIVSFTPWCSSTSVSKVMSTLNNLFKSFDSLINQKPTMSKIKCIGDCYMAAGGIFSDVNNPTQHAKEAIEFGLEAIDVVRRINSEMKIDLSIRVGINTGGPIVAGVIGTSKPTFEILGPSINLAHQMESNGVPMSVHATRSVIELIYGENYNIQEKGEMSVKGKKIITYLVSKEKQ